MQRQSWRSVLEKKLIGIYGQKPWKMPRGDSFLNRSLTVLKVNSLISIFQNFRPQLPQVLFLEETPSFAEHLSLSDSGN